MKLLTYDTGAGPRCGVLQGDHVVDVTALLGANQTLRDVQALLETGNSAIDQVGDALGRSAATPGAPLASVRLRSPVLRPPTVRDFMIYEEHATAQGTREQVEAWYRMPIFYFSSPLCIFGPDDQIPFPGAAERLDYELELGCIIGRAGSNVSEADGMSYVAGYTIFNDWSCRDLQMDEMAVRLGPAKGKDSASTAKPWFCVVISTLPVSRSNTGWFTPRCPNFNLNVLAPQASDNNWWPRQIPKIGVLPINSRIVLWAYSSGSGSPGPFDRKTPSGSSLSISDADVSPATIVTRLPREAK